jgi:hypothetical protein
MWRCRKFFADDVRRRFSADRAYATPRARSSIEDEARQKQGRLRRCSHEMRDP